MDYLFTPWRYAYITAANAPGDCLFCGLLQTKNDEQTLIVHRAKNCFVMLNAFPYTSGHVMIVPYDHVDELTKLSQPAAQEMMELTQPIYDQAGGVPEGVGSPQRAGIKPHARTDSSDVAAPISQMERDRVFRLPRPRHAAPRRGLENGWAFRCC